VSNDASSFLVRPKSTVPQREGGQPPAILSPLVSSSVTPFVLYPFQDTICLICFNTLGTLRASVENRVISKAQSQGFEPHLWADGMLAADRICRTFVPRCSYRSHVCDFIGQILPFTVYEQGTPCPYCRVHSNDWFIFHPLSSFHSTAPNWKVGAVALLRSTACLCLPQFSRIKSRLSQRRAWVLLPLHRLLLPLPQAGGSWQ